MNIYDFCLKATTKDGKRKLSQKLKMKTVNAQDRCDSYKVSLPVRLSCVQEVIKSYILFLFISQAMPTSTNPAPVPVKLVNWAEAVHEKL